MLQSARGSKFVRPAPASPPGAVCSTKAPWPTWALLSLVVVLAAACGGDGGGTGTGDTGARADTGPADSGADTGPADCTTDIDCPDDGVFCNGRFRCQGGRCVAADIPTCNDGTACTQDMCMPVMDMCQNTPNDTLCPTGLTCVPGMGCVRAPACEFDSDCEGDGIFCNGDEVCVVDEEDMVRVCASPGTRSCDDFDNCTMDECSEVSGECMHVMRTDNLTNPEACGPECEPCPVPPPEGHARAVCLMGVCGYECEAGFYDADSDASNWCESDCFPSMETDFPDDTFADLNCDGIDGTAAAAIFVATTGRDINPGTRAMPKRTIRAGIEAANEVGFDVYISEGDYNEGPEPLALADGVSLYGGYSAERSWERSNDFIVTINGGVLAVDAVNIAMDTTVDRVNVRASGNANFGGSSIGVRAVDSPGLIWRVGEVTAANGGPGRDGSPGVDGMPGAAGNPSIGGVEYGCDCPFGVCFGCSSDSPSGPAAGGTSPCGSTGGIGAAAGRNTRRGGSTGGMGLGPGGGAGGPGAGSDRGNGSRGTDGTSPMFSATLHGGAGNGRGVVVSDTWRPGDGADGNDGVAGGGGGGGGSGGGDDPDLFGCCETSGDTGAGGGGGGCGGTGGTGGGGGGGSIGFLLIRSPMSFDLVLITTANGANGGRGATGGTGGMGGAPGIGSSEAAWSGTRNDDDQGRGGGGGRGGTATMGGAGGGGGGGPSVGILRDSMSSISTRMTSYTLGSAGRGGDSPGNDGEDGVRGNEVMLP